MLVPFGTRVGHDVRALGRGGIASFATREDCVGWPGDESAAASRRVTITTHGRTGARAALASRSGRRSGGNLGDLSADVASIDRTRKSNGDIRGPLEQRARAAKRV